MNKVFGLLIATALVVGIVPYARSVDTPVLPPGISASNWVAMGDAAGFVITNSRTASLKGYFMARRGGTWVRIDSAPEDAFHPAVEAR
jgi:hypothetical protein